MAQSKGEKKAAREKSTAFLSRILGQGDEVFGVVTTVSRSGMSRRIRFFIGARGQNGLYVHEITFHVAQVLGLNRNTNGALVHGVGMDMVFDTVYRLSRALFDGDGYALSSSH